MTKELIDRLRAIAGFDTATNEMTCSQHVCWSAADEIERLERKLIMDDATAMEQNTITINGVEYVRADQKPVGLDVERQMTDHELLELAAKAAGYEKDWHWNHHFIMSAGGSVKEGNSWITWNPLTDDGDALRLAVKLGLIVEVSKQDSWTFISYTCCDAKPSISEKHHADAVAATRRAIVRAAAEIGRRC